MSAPRRSARLQSNALRQEEVAQVVAPPAPKKTRSTKKRTASGKKKSPSPTTKKSKRTTRRVTFKKDRSDDVTVDTALEAIPTAVVEEESTAVTDEPIISPELQECLNLSPPIEEEPQKEDEGDVVDQSKIETLPLAPFEAMNVDFNAETLPETQISAVPETQISAVPEPITESRSSISTIPVDDTYETSADDLDVTWEENVQVTSVRKDDVLVPWDDDGDIFLVVENEITEEELAEKVNEGEFEILQEGEEMVEDGDYIYTTYIVRKE